MTRYVITKGENGAAAPNRGNSRPRKQKNPENVNIPAGAGGFGLKNGKPFFVQDQK